MVIQILANNRSPKKVPTSRKFSDALGVAIEGGNNILSQYQQAEALRSAGIDPRMPPEMQKLSFQNQLAGNLQDQKGKQGFENQLGLLREKNSSEANLQKERLEMQKMLQQEKIQSQKEIEAEKLRGNQQEKIAPLQAGLETIQKMRQISQGNNLGRGSSALGFFGGQTAQDRAMYSQLGKSLISLASNIPIRNQREFETLAHDLYDPSLPDDAREGILQAMEAIIMGNMQQFQNGESINNNPIQSSVKNNRPPLSSFMR